VSFLLAGLATVLLALIWHWRIRPGSPETGAALPPSLSSGLRAQTKTLQPQWRLLFGNSSLLLLTISCFCLNYFDYVFFFWIYYYMGTIRHFEEIESAVATTAIFLTGTAMSPIGGWLSDRLVDRYGEKNGRRLVPVVCLTFAVTLLCLSISLTSKTLVVVCLSLSFGLAFMSDAPYWVAAIRLGGKQMGAACGILNTGANLGGIAPYLAPLIASYFGWTWGLYSAALVLMLGVLIWFWIDPSRSEGVSEGDS